MFDCTKLGRAWRDWIGKVERLIQLKPELDPLTRQMRTFPPIKETAPFAYLIDQEINNDKEKWAQIVEYIRRNAPVSWEQTMTNGKQTLRLMDDIEKMAKPLARDAHSEVDLEPEDVIVIPLPKVSEQKEPEGPTVEVVKEQFKCPDCERSFEAKQGLRLHRVKKHSEQKVA